MAGSMRGAEMANRHRSVANCQLQARILRLKLLMLILIRFSNYW